MKQVLFRANEELIKKVKIKAIQNDQNMTQYLVALIEKDLDENETEKEQTR